MEKLTAKKKLSVLMSYFRGLSYDEISAKTGVSKGTGTWGPPMRVFAEPEITVFHLLPAKKR